MKAVVEDRTTIFIIT